jgi:hypothetical protein
LFEKKITPLRGFEPRPAIFLEAISRIENSKKNEKSPRAGFEPAIHEGSVFKATRLAAASS